MREQFERAILERPDDREAYSVYADWLSEAGDPRGEYIQVQLRLEEEGMAPAAREPLRVRERELFEAHGRTWLGSLAGPLLDHASESDWDVRRYRFVRGFLESIEASELDVALTLGLRGCPETRFLRELTLLNTAYIEEEVEVAGVAIGEGDSLVPLLSAAALENVRIFQLGGLEPDNCHTRGEGAVDVVRLLPKLESLTLMAHRVDTQTLFGLSMPHLRELTVYHVHEYPLERLAANPSLSRLELLACRPHALEPDDDEPYIRLDGLLALIGSPHMKKLRHLELRSSNLGDEGVEQLVASPLFQQLDVLSLVYGEITDAGARLFAAHPHSKKLTTLDLSGNALTNEGIEALAEAGIAHVSGEQFELGDDREYLWHGDME